MSNPYLLRPSIIHFGKYHWDQPGGLETYIRQWLRLFRNSGSGYFEKIYQVYFSREERTSDSTEIVELPLRHLFSLRSAPLFVPKWKTLKNLFTLKPEIIHFHHPNPSVHPLLSLLLWRNPQAKLVIHYHSDIVKQKFLRLLYAPFLNRLLKRADVIIASSPPYVEASPILRKFRNKCAIIPFGIENRERTQDLKPFPRKARLLFVGRLVGYKGVEYLIRALAILKNQPWECHIIGTGPLENSLKALAASLGLQENLKFLGRLSFQELNLEMQSADVFILPSVSRAEAFGLVILEAMSYGVPVITTKLGSGMEYLVQDGLNGLVIPPRDPAALAQAIQRVIDHPEQGALMGQRSQERQRHLFSEKVHFESLIRTYDELLQTTQNSELKVASSPR